MKYIMVREVPDNVHKAFKLLCVERGKSINSEVIRLIREEVEKGGKSK